MSVVTGQSVTVDFTTRNGTTGAGVNADSLPTGKLSLNGTDNAATVTVTNKSTGVYKAQVTLPTLAIGDEVVLRIAATVNSVADAAVIWGDVCDLEIDANGRLDVSKIAGQTASAAGSVTFPGSIGTSTYAGGAVASVTGNVGGNVVGTIGGYASGQDPATLVFAQAIESGISMLQMMRLMGAALAGVLAGAATTTVTISAANNSGTTRISATVDANGNRTALTLTP